MAAVFGDYPGGAAQHGAHRRTLQRRRCRRARTTCRTSTCRPASRSTSTSSTSCARASRSGCRGCGELAGARRAAPHDRRVRARGSSYEIEMIKRMKYPGYFLIVWDFIRYAREQRHPGRPGPRIGGRQPRRLLPAHHRRRSARTSTCIFERFLNPERVSLPDIDIDFCERRRGEVIDVRHARSTAARTSRRSSRSAR